MRCAAQSLASVLPLLALLFCGPGLVRRSWAQGDLEVDEAQDYRFFRRGVLGGDVALGLGVWGESKNQRSGFYLESDFLARLGKPFYLGGGLGLWTSSAKGKHQGTITGAPLQLKARFSTRGLSWFYLDAGTGFYLMSFDMDPGYDPCPFEPYICTVDVEDRLGYSLGAGVMFQVGQTFHIGLGVTRHFIKTEFVETREPTFSFASKTEIRTPADLSASAFWANFTLRF